MSNGPSRRKVAVADTATLPLFASAMRKKAPVREQVEVGDKPRHLSSGLPSLDKALRGGFAMGEATLIAARPKVGATSLLLGGSLAALKRDERVAYFSESLREEQIRGRFVVLDSRVNGYRFKAGFVTAEDRIALAAARERIPWGALSIVTRKRIAPEDVDGHVFSYSPWLVVADILPRGSSGATTRKVSNLLAGVEQLVDIARKHQVALLVRVVLPRAEHPPNRLELPGVGAMAEAFSSVVLLHREEVTDPTGVPDEAMGMAEASVVRVNSHDVEPRVVSLRFDQRFAGILEM
jgi:replicative DNA helicase